MRRIRTTPRSWSGSSLLFAAWPLAGCVVLPNGGTTDVALETGADSSESGEAGSSTGRPDDSSSSSSGAGSAEHTGDASSGSSETTADPEDTSGSSGEPSLCGNGAVDPGEDCDGAEIAVDSCAALDAKYTEGVPVCDATCKLDTSPCQTCDAPTIVPCDKDSDDPFHALELGCDSTPITNAAVSSQVDANAFKTVRRFGKHATAWLPRAGDRALLISNGSLGDLDADGALLMPPGSAQNGKNQNSNPDLKGENGVIEGMRIHMFDGAAAPFTECDVEAHNDCSNTLADQWNQFPAKMAYDIVYLELETKVPSGTHGFALDLAFFTAHYPEYNQAPWNDMTVVWVQSERYVGNISYVKNGDENFKPLNLNSLYAAKWMTHNGATDPVLEGTGYDGKPTVEGGASDWLTVSGPAAPNETLILAITVFDLDENYRDTAMLLDNFRWSCAGCEPGVDCGVTLAAP